MADSQAIASHFVPAVDYCGNQCRRAVCVFNKIDHTDDTKPFDGVVLAYSDWIHSRLSFVVVQHLLTLICDEQQVRLADGSVKDNTQLREASRFFELLLAQGFCGEDRHNDC